MERGVMPFVDLGFARLPMYGLMVALGLLLASLAAARLMRGGPLLATDFTVMAATGLALGFLGAKLLYLAVSFPVRDIPGAALSMLSGRTGGGFVFYGGLAGGGAGLLLGARIAGARLSDYIDLFAAVVPLAHAFGRLGCFFAGCCYGMPYDGPLSVRYERPLSSAPGGTGLFPVQLAEAAALLVLSLALARLYASGRRSVWAAYLASYAVLRFLLEFLRGDLERGFVGGLSLSQVASLAVLAAVAAGEACRLFRKGRRIP